MQQLVWEHEDWIAVPAGARHWFDMGPQPSFCTLRFFNDQDGWVTEFTGKPIVEGLPLLEELQGDC